MVARRMFAIARSGLAGRVVRLVFARAAWALPVRRVALTRRVIAFHHPWPAWPVHLLLVPRRPIPSLLAVEEDDLPALAALLALAADLPARLDLDAPLVLVINGGAWQDVGQLHAHLVTDPAFVFDPPPGPAVEGLAVLPHPRPARPFHTAIGLPAGAVPTPSALGTVLAAVAERVARHDLAPPGFALVTTIPAAGEARWFHLISGARERSDASA